MNNLTLGSLFDGSGGFPLGGLISGITPVWASEIEPFPIRVTTKRLPFMKHYGDISQMDGGKIEPVDIITFGSPCTDMSVAGRRAGLDGKQSVLFYQAIRIIKEMRCATNGKYPRYIVWENVPGAFSSNGGEDFKAVLEAVIGITEPDTQVPMPEKNRWPYADCYMGDGWSVAYRVLDAQYWGVPQRRKRIYLVADLTGGRAAHILFKSEGVSGYSAEGFRSWQMIHNPMTAAFGDSAEMQKAIEMLGSVKDSIINAYEIKTGLTRAKLSHLMDAETWMDANKAVELGFADGILKRDSDMEDVEAPTVSMLYSKANVVNSLMDKIAHKCAISPKSNESTTHKHRADDYMARLDLIKNWR